MSFNFPIKRQNHRVHPCESKRKIELLQTLIASHEGDSILVLTCKESAPIIAGLNNSSITVLSDSELPSSVETKYDMLISYDLPQSVKLYMLRILHINTTAVVLLDSDEQHRLYPIETVLGRTILQEIISGFDSTATVIETPDEPKFRDSRKEFKRDDREQNTPRRDFKYDDKKSSAPRKEFKRDDRKSKEPRKEFKYDDKKPRDNRDTKSTPKPWDKKKEKSKFMGKDENGKPIFSAKSGERNHRYDGTPKSNEEKDEYRSKKNNYKKSYANSNSPKPKNSGKKILIKPRKLPKK